MKNENEKLPLVALLGRANVGKSTLFNCLTEKQQAIVSDIPGTTRDSNYGFVSWNNRDFELVDTAGIFDSKHINNDFKKAEAGIDFLAQKQVRKTLDEAAIIIFMVDNRAGLLTEDRHLAAALKKNPELLKKTIVVVNKVDSQRYANEAMINFVKLGLGQPHLISATTGSGTGDLLDEIVTILKPYTDNKIVIEDRHDEIKVCIIGKPNVGKSSLLNSILGYERVIVSDEPHTTREPQDTVILWGDKKIRFVDTAGISRQGHKGDGLQKLGIGKSLHVLDKADIALFVFDVSETLTHQDAKIVGEIIERNKSLILIANKWDKVEVKDTKKWTQDIYHELPFAAWAPLQFIAAKTGLKVQKIMDLVTTIAEARKIEISDSQLQKFLMKIVKIHLPAKGKGLKAPRIYEFNQVRSNPPSFDIRIGSKDNLHFSYVRFMENRLREKWGFTGTPIRMTVVKNRKVHGTAS
jgi:GTP-binding protein